MSGKRNREEDALQIAAVQFIRLALPGCVCFHVPNGGARTKAEAGIFKAMGVVAGIPDLWIVYAGSTLALEMKAPMGVMGDSQLAVHKALEAQGCSVGTAWSLADVERLLRVVWGSQVRGKVS